MIDNLKDKTVLIAGGAGYLGLPLCDLIASQGGNICIGEKDQTALKYAIDFIRSKYSKIKVLGLNLDVRDQASIKQFIADSFQHFGAIDGLVNATAAGTNKSIDDLTADDFDYANQINLTGPFLMVREASQHMYANGSIVLYSSMYGVVSPKQADYPDTVNRNPVEYGAGKAGAIQMVRYLASHYGPRGIRVNAVAPGPFPNIKKLKLPADFISNLEHNTMLGRVGEPHETAGPVTFLLSNAASYITGHTLVVDGGWTAW